MRASCRLIAPWRWASFLAVISRTASSRLLVPRLARFRVTESKA